ncbi:MAG TPA: hypothetical protein VFV67_09825 [Actinophytocola sp.]|uniref:hypothetical protein n=1 Tax=Actinophytocola sp. TaxID=1872138 RepID=UPI002DBD96BA|nr:hypothetical protein [Actinophytocola sp.]HEU5470938.1 hypothetical protein [Actinophytocola sp.]
MGKRRADDQADPDFAEEHTRPTVADEPGPDAPDESVPTGQAGNGGMDPRGSFRRWLRTVFRRQ